MTDSEAIALVRNLSGTYDADSTPGYYDALKRVLELAELAAFTAPPSGATKEQVLAWGIARWHQRIAAERRADTYKAALDSSAG
jgi:hypothetical protein